MVDPTGRHHQLANLHVLDGSLFPTSIGANPQLSIYGIVARLAAGLAATLAPGAGADRSGARDAPLRAPAIRVFALTPAAILNAIARCCARPLTRQKGKTP